MRAIRRSPFWAFRHRNPRVKEAIHQICRADTVFYDHDSVVAALQPIVASAADGVAVLSYENFALYESKDKGLIAERLARLFPEAWILFTIRRQQDLAAAWYLQKMQRCLRAGHYLSFEDWFEMMAKLPHCTILDDLCFDRIIACYRQIFGAERVHVLLFEELRANPPSFSRHLGKVLGIAGDSIEALLAERQANPTIPSSAMIAGRWLFPLLPRALSRRSAKLLLRRGGNPARVEVNDTISGHLASLCAPGNRRIAPEFNLPLADHGYSL